MKWMPSTWGNVGYNASLSSYAYRVGPRWSPRRKIRRKRNRQWMRNIFTAAKKVKTLSCTTNMVEGFPTITYELESDTERTILHVLAFGVCTGTAALPIKTIWT